jgi:hypothetical protein
MKSVLPLDELIRPELDLLPKPPPFKHGGLARLSEQENSDFLNNVVDLIHYLQSFVPQDPPGITQSALDRKLESIRKHLSALEGLLEDLPSPGLWVLLTPNEMGAASGASGRHDILSFPQTVKDFKARLDEVIREKYLIAHNDSKIPVLIAEESYNLLKLYCYAPSITIGGLWHELTAFVILHGLKRHETDENIKNILREAKKGAEMV